MEVFMRRIDLDHLTGDDQKVARRIYLAMAACYTSLLLLLGVLVAFNIPSRGTDALSFGRIGLFSAVAAERPGRAQCAARDLKLLTSLNERGEAQDVAADDLRTAFFALVKARGVCAAGRVDEALAIYDSVVIGAGKTAQK
jgi:hypothetical protein